MYKNDTLNDYFTKLSEFTSMCSHLDTKDFDEFEVWFEKLYKKDKRALFFFLKDNKEMLTSEQLRFVEKMFSNQTI